MFCSLFLAWILDYCIYSFVEHFFGAHCINTNFLLGCFFSFIFPWDEHDADSFSQDTPKLLPPCYARVLRNKGWGMSLLRSAGWCNVHSMQLELQLVNSIVSETLMYVHQLKVITHEYCKGSKPPKYKSMHNSNKQLLMYHLWLLESCVKEQITDKLYAATATTTCN